MARNAIREIIPGKVYQRGQILTWQREKKYQIFEEYGIKFVVNFWPKMDADLAEAPLKGYLHIPATKSIEMLSPEIEQVALLVGTLCKRSPTLVLCEAGMTRSVYFCMLVASTTLGIRLEDAREYVLEKVSRTSIKGFMNDRLTNGYVVGERKKHTKKKKKKKKTPHRN